MILFFILVPSSGSPITPNYVDNSSSSVAPWCTCNTSGNRQEECEKFLHYFTNNICLRKSFYNSFQERTDHRGVRARSEGPVSRDGGPAWRPCYHPFLPLLNNSDPLPPCSTTLLAQPPPTVLASLRLRTSAQRLNAISPICLRKSFYNTFQGWTNHRAIRALPKFPVPGGPVLEIQTTTRLPPLSPFLFNNSVPPPPLPFSTSLLPQPPLTLHSTTLPPAQEPSPNNPASLLLPPPAQ